MKQWIVTVEYAGPGAPADPDALDRFLDRLDRSAVVTGTPEAAPAGECWYGATISVETTGVRITTAISVALGVLDGARYNSGLPELETVSVEAITDAEQDRRLALPTFETVGVVEAARILGVVKQRVSQLHRTDERFPTPIAFTRPDGRGPIWRRSDVEEYGRLDRPHGHWRQRAGKVYAD